MQSKVKRRPFGNTGVMVSEVGFGAMNLRTLPDHESVLSFIHGVLDQGINLIDTARAYNSKPARGQSNSTGVEISSEVMLGRAISARKNQEPLVIITKGHGYDAKSFDEDFATSMECLQIRREKDGLYIGGTKIYLAYLLHGIKEDRWGPIRSSGVLEHAKKRQQNGDFTWLGFSSHYGDGKVIKEAIDTGAFQVCELPYNVYNPSLGEEGETDLLRYAFDRGIAVINMKAFNGNGTAAIFPQISAYSGFGYAEMLRYCLGNPYVATIDAGFVNMEQVMLDIEASLLPALTQEERAGLREMAKRVSPYLNTICRECMHCVEKFECPTGIDFPRILGLHGRYTVSGGLGLSAGDFQEQYAAFAPGAEACIECGQCIPWCEYHLNVPAMMKRAAADLG